MATGFPVGGGGIPPSGGGATSRPEGLVVRYRSSGDLMAQGQQQDASPPGHKPCRSGFAFSHDEAATDKQIAMIMRNR